MTTTIISVFAPDTWRLYEHQRQFIAATTPDARHVIVSTEQPPFDCDWVRAPRWPGGQHPYRNVPSLRWSRQHEAALHAALHRVSDTGLVVLCDSDAFPVRRDWPETILRCLRDNRRDFAAPVRAENCDCFPHVSFLAFPSRQTPLILRYARVAPGRTMFGTQRVDTGGGLPLDRCFPLLRSNRSNPHPWVHAIYGDMAYHRCRGSLPGFRGQAWDYWHQLVPVPAPADPQTPEDMVSLINDLLGERRFAVVEGTVTLT